MTIEEQINAHIADLNNPHGITKEDIGLGGIANFVMASPVEAEAGNVPDRFVSPATLKDTFNGVLKREGLMDADGNVIFR